MFAGMVTAMLALMSSGVRDAQLPHGAPKVLTWTLNWMRSESWFPSWTTFGFHVELQGCTSPLPVLRVYNSMSYKPNIKDWYATFGSRSGLFHLWFVRFLLPSAEKTTQDNPTMRSQPAYFDRFTGKFRRAPALRLVIYLLTWWFYNHFGVQMSNSWSFLGGSVPTFPFFSGKVNWSHGFSRFYSM